MSGRPQRFIEIGDSEDWWDEYLETLENTGEYAQAAYAIDADPRAIRRYRQDNPQFAAFSERAKEIFAQKLRNAAFTRAVDGTPKFTLGGRERDQVIQIGKEYDSRMLELYLKRTDPSFVDRHQVQVSADSDLQGLFNYASMSPKARKLARALMEQIKVDQTEKSAAD